MRSLKKKIEKKIKIELKELKVFSSVKRIINFIT